MLRCGSHGRPREQDRSRVWQRHSACAVRGLCSALFFQVLVALDLGFADADLARRIVVRIPQRK